jgi:extradiol dioxygenase family protein
MTPPRFHLAFPVRDLAATRAFYEGLLGATVGRESERWIDFDFWGHQISAHVVDDIPAAATNAVDGQAVPTRHFGVILDMPKWRDLAERLTAAGTAFLIDPQVRFEGQVGEQATMFFLDPSGNALEFKAFEDDTQVFAR